MSKLEELLNKECPDGVEYVELSSVINYEQPSKYIVENTKYNDDYDTPVLTAGQTFILGYTNEKDGIYKASKKEPVIIFDDFTTSFHWVDFNFKVKSSAMKMLKVIDENKSNFRYLYYCMKNIKYVPLDHTRQWIEKYSKFMIPLPPIKVQKEIVRILDEFIEKTTKLQELLHRETILRKKQYEYYRGKLLTFGDEVELKNFGEVCDVVTDYVAAGSFKDIAKNVEYIRNPDYAQLVRTTDIKNNFKNDGFVYINKKAFDYLYRVNLDKESIILPNIGINCGEVYYITPNMLPYKNNALGPNAILVRSSNTNNKFLSYIFEEKLFQTQLRRIISTAGQPKFNKTELKKIKIPVPPLEEQERIVNILDKFDALCNDITKGLPAEIEMRKKQYEYYRDKLLTFKEKK
ncbi:restriction endonuclease subunit S [Brachyspira pilosicoli]|uniref:restriction endonuclease subunit S n=1 Tax=Brachyspira pilosicoli TaxID=52584 RepID=UPI000C76D0A9|nr:restriction endonuclease subunit S [Brachyspira pilosicoli]PLV55178.1 restriciton endonuclease subunit S [Brachyspira pilosicoli SP16]